ncbi:hypothetical protein PCASD_24000 [Puccinia coronata f. sp. avenae]|uniref:Uncharacterized protein n=1 Tax=Puccinia coronata f. sp. avenae TaxID=200324 RepID=A0A2N5S3Y8_9BASI|nr:hypothetical protein PCASD_24000 [Puccinia coronata f. sp. avenae]
MNSVFGLKITTNGHAFQDMEYDIVRAEEYGVASGAHSRTVHNGEDLELQIHTGVESSIIDPRDKIRLDYDPKFPWLLTTRDKRVFLKKKLYDELVNDEAINNLKEHAAKSLAENQPETDMAYNDQPRKELDNKLVQNTSEGAEIVTTKESESPTDESRTSGEQIDLKNSRTASAAKIESQSPKNQPKKPIREQINLKTASVESSHKEGPDKELLRTVHDTFTSKSKEINFDPQSQVGSQGNLKKRVTLQLMGDGIETYLCSPPNFRRCNIPRHHCQIFNYGLYVSQPVYSIYDVEKSNNLLSPVPLRPSYVCQDYFDLFMKAYLPI